MTIGFRFKTFDLGVLGASSPSGSEVSSVFFGMDDVDEVLLNLDLGMLGFGAALDSLELEIVILELFEEANDFSDPYSLVGWNRIGEVGVLGVMGEENESSTSELDSES